MTKELWLNFPARDLVRTKKFYTHIGFKLNEQQTNETMVCFQVGKNQTTVLFFPEETIKTFTKNNVSDTKKGSEVLVSFDAESTEEIDDTARKVFEAGGTIVSEPAEIQGWMYGFAFADLDGHRWNQIFMDFGKLPKN